MFREQSTFTNSLLPSYIYALICPITRKPRYVGYTNLPPQKRLASHIRDARAKKLPRHLWINSLLAQNKTPLIKVLEQTNDWDQAERRWIKRLRANGAQLLNQNDGGKPFYSRKVNKKGVSIPHGRKHVRLWRALRTTGQMLNGGRYWSPSPPLKQKLLAGQAYLRYIATLDDASILAFENALALKPAWSHILNRHTQMKPFTASSPHSITAIPSAKSVSAYEFVEFTF